MIHCFAGATGILNAIGLTFRDLSENQHDDAVRFERDPQPGEVRAFIERETRNTAALRRREDPFDFAVIRSADINAARRRANVYFGLTLKPVARRAWEGYAPHDCDPMWPLLFDRAHLEATWECPDARRATRQYFAAALDDAPRTTREVVFAMGLALGTDAALDRHEHRPECAARSARRESVGTHPPVLLPKCERASREACRAMLWWTRALRARNDLAMWNPNPADPGTKKFYADFLAQLEAALAYHEAKHPAGSIEATATASLKRLIALQREMAELLGTFTLANAAELVRKVNPMQAEMLRLYADSRAQLQEADEEYDRDLAAAVFSEQSAPPPANAFEDEPDLNADDDDFAEEAGTGGGYDWLISRPLFSNDGIARRIVSRFVGKPVERVSIILEEVRGGAFGKLMRYDDSRQHGGRFHRHLPGWPDAGAIDAYIDDVELPQRNAVAVGEIRRRYTAWEAEVFGQEGGDPK